MSHENHSIKTPFQNTHWKCEIFEKNFEKELQAQKAETKKRKQQEEEADEEIAAKMPVSETDSEYEASLTIQPILKYPVGKKTQWINILQFLLHKQQKKLTGDRGWTNMFFFFLSFG